MKIHGFFEINQYITVRLESDETIIYVAGKRFQQCKYLFIMEPDKLTKKEINSIDEAKDLMGSQLEHEIEPEDLGITPAEMFWGYCSNLQAWAEHDYDGRLIHSNLAFPLLNELAKVGDKKALRALQEETKKKMENENFFTLLEEDYFNFMDHETVLRCIFDEHRVELLLKIEEQIGKSFDLNVIYIPLHRYYIWRDHQYIGSRFLDWILSMCLKRFLRLQNLNGWTFHLIEN